MSIPDYEKMAHTILEHLMDATEEVGLAAFREKIAKRFGVTKEEQENRLKSGEKRFDNCVRWVACDARSAGLLWSPRLGHFKVTQDGRHEFRKGTVLSRKYLKQRYHDIKIASEKSQQAGNIADPRTNYERADLTPDEEIESALHQIDDALVEDILDRAREIGGERFEQITINLLEAMTYGTGEKIEDTGDDGIDGIINEDELGFRQIGIQAKCYAEGRTIGPEHVRAFHGALGSRGFQKGVIVTTSSFTSEALQVVQELQEANKRIVTINGKQLARLMLKHNIGCKRKHLVKNTIDEHFWSSG